MDTHNGGKMKVIINVTADHINAGHRCDSRECPIALAVIEAFRRYRVNVNMAYIQVNKRRIIYDTKQSELRVITMPDIAADFIHNFDNDIPVNPFSFEVEVRDE